MERQELLRRRNLCAFTALGAVVLLVASGLALARGPRHEGMSAKSGGTSKACARTSQTLRKACLASANDDYYTAIARCENLTDPDEKAACLLEAKEARKESIEECADQYDARREVCDALGEGPYDPVIAPANFVATIDNPLMPLGPGTTFVYETVTAAGTERVTVEVTHETKTILGVACIVVRDTAELDGQVTEDTMDWFAQDTAGNVWYFGELSQQFEDDELVSLEGSWKAGVDGAKPGIVMEAQPAVGDVYRQEFSAGIAEDLGEVLGLDESGITVPHGSFDHCLLTRDFTPLEPDANEHKYYASGVGLVLTADVETGDREELISVTTGN